MTGTHTQDYDDHWERTDVVWPVCASCRKRYRRDLGCKCGAKP